MKFATLVLVGSLGAGLSPVTASAEFLEVQQVIFGMD